METTGRMPRQPDELLTPAEVARWFHVDPKTVTRWARSGKFPPAVITPGGHRRYRAADVEAFFAAGEVSRG